MIYRSNQKLKSQMTAVLSAFAFLSLPLLYAETAAVDQGKSGSIIISDTPGQHSSSAERFRIEPPAVIAISDDNGDHLAKVFEFKGDVRILKKTSDEWKLVEKGMIVGVGDQVLTGKDSHLDISYDNYYLNVARIEQNTKAEFLNIEPTIVRLEDGAIFNALDGLNKDESYQIATPTAVAAVRGTYFPVSFDAESGLLQVAVLDQKDAAVEHKIELTQILADGSEGAKLEVSEGLQFDLGKDQQIFSSELIKPMEVDMHARYETIVFDDLMSAIDPADRKQGLERLGIVPTPDPVSDEGDGGRFEPRQRLDDFDSALDEALLEGEEVGSSKLRPEGEFAPPARHDTYLNFETRDPGQFREPMMPPQDGMWREPIHQQIGEMQNSTAPPPPPPCEPPNCY